MKNQKKKKIDMKNYLQEGYMYVIEKLFEKSVCVFNAENLGVSQ